MSAGWQAFFFAVAIAFFLLFAALDGLKATVMADRRQWLIAAGLATFVFVFFWTAVKAA